MSSTTRSMRKDFVTDSWALAPSEPAAGPPIPGMLIRRAHQANTALWALCIQEDITIRQFAILRLIAEGRRVDQSSLGRHAALDRSNTADILSRLEAHGLVARHRDGQDARRNIWQLTEAGEAVFHRANPLAAMATELLLAPLNAADREEFLRLLQLLVDESEQRIASMQRRVRDGTAR